MGRWLPLEGNTRACPVSLAHCCRSECDRDGCAYIGAWPPPPDKHDPTRAGSTPIRKGK